MSFLGDLVSNFRLDSHDAERGAESLSEKFDHLQHTLELIAGVELFRGAREIGNIVLEKLKGPAEYADRILSMSAAAGLGAEQLQKLQFSAQQNGVSAENASMSLVHLNRTLEESRQGSKEATKAFMTLGISADQVKGFRDSDEALMVITDRLKNMQDPIQRSAVAMQIFGRSGASQLKWLAAGSEEMATMKARAEALGAVVSESDTKSLNEMGDIIESVGTAVKGFVSTLTARLAPSIIGIVTRIEDWWIANRKLIQSGIERWIDNFLYWAGYLTGIIEGIIGLVIDWVMAHKLLFQWIEKVAEDAIAALGEAILAAVNWIGSFIKNNQDLITTLIDIALFIGAVAAGVALWEGVTGIITAFKAGLEGIRAVMAAIDVATALASIEIYAIVAAVLALAAAIDLVVEMLFQHKSFKDTFLGKIDGGVQGLVKSLSSVLPGTENAGEKTDLGDASGTPFGDRLAALAGGGANFAGLASYASAAQVPSALAPNAAYGPQNAAFSMVPQNVTISAPLTVNAPPGADPQQIQAGINKQIQEHMDRITRQAQRATQPNVRH